jgi:hypothetical protein
MSSDINEIAEQADTYKSRRKLNRERYARLLEELVKFAQGRVADQHKRGIPWFIRTGIPLLEQGTGETIPHPP